MVRLLQIQEKQHGEQEYEDAQLEASKLRDFFLFALHGLLDVFPSQLAPEEDTEIDYLIREWVKK